MSGWLTWFQNYLNPSKITAVTVPGMVVAFALVLVLGPVPCRKQVDCPYCSGSLKPVEDKTANGNAAPSPANGAAPANGATAASVTSPAAPADVPQLYIRVSRQTINQESAIDEINRLIANVNAKTPPSQDTPDIQQLRDALNLVQNGQDDNAAGPAVPGVVPTKPFVSVAAKNDLDDKCGKLPSFAVAGSLTALDKKGYDTAKKAADKLGQDLKLLADLQSLAKSCGGPLQDIYYRIAQDGGALQKFIDQAGTDLTSLSTNLVNALNAGESLVAASLERRIHEKRDMLAWAQSKQTAIKNTQDALQRLKTRVDAMTALATNAPADAPKDTSSVMDVLAAIQDNLIKFLILSLILGQILDPIQRGVVSFFGPRRDFFKVYNLVYGQNGDGEFRYGDRRLSPWMTDDGVLLTANRADATLNRLTTEAELRPNPASRAFVRDRNIYDKNYAIGAGYISQSDAKTIEDDFFSQSQITSGLILPLIILSVCLGIRTVCCSVAASKGFRGPTEMILWVILLGILLGGVGAFAALFFSSETYWRAIVQKILPVEPQAVKVATKPAREGDASPGPYEKHTTRAKTNVVSLRYLLLVALVQSVVIWFTPNSWIVLAEALTGTAALYLVLKLHSGRSDGKLESRKSLLDPDRDRLFAFSRDSRHAAIFSCCLIVAILGVKQLHVAHTNPQGSVPTMSDLLFIMLPVLPVAPLWIAGLDRLHKYYSELQARIAGNILRLEATTEQKFFDLLSDDTAACAMKAKFKSTADARKALDALLKDRKCHDEKGDEPPAGDQTDAGPGGSGGGMPSPPPSGSAPSGGSSPAKGGNS